MNEQLVENLRWFVGHLDRPDLPANRLHVRGVWHDVTGGSAIGSPMTARAFAAWLEAGERSRRTVVEQVTCQHFRQALPNACPDCGDRGSYERPVEVYRYPMRAAMSRASHVTVRAGRPNLAVVLHILGRSGGDLAMAQTLLAREFPAMGDDRTAVEHIGRALNRARALYTDVAPVRYAERSEAQLNAEASSVA